MEPITIVRRRSRLWPILLAVIIIALLIAAALFFLGDAAATSVDRGITRDATVAFTAWPPDLAPNGA